MSNLEERQALIGEMAEHLKKNIYHSEERKITTPRKEYQAESQRWFLWRRLSAVPA